MRLYELEMNQNNAMNKYLISGTNSLNSIILYINWLLAEEFYTDNKLSKAIDYYEMAYSSSSYNTTSLPLLLNMGGIIYLI